VGIAVLLAIGSALRYPGGTPHDHSTAGYSLSRNFLSDLGMTVSYDGGSNRLGAALFILSLLILVVGLGGALLGFVRMCSDVPRARFWSRAAGFAGLLACVGFVGVAMTPENRVMALHIGFTLFAWRIVAVASLCLTFAFIHVSTFPRRVRLTWAAMTAGLFLYVALLGWGPSPATPDGLLVDVLAQKLITVIVVGALTYLSIEADRILTRSTYFTPT
jgi:hypothetical protein